MNEPEGFYNSLFEVTNQRLAERRTAMLNRMASIPALNADAVCAHIIATLETNRSDIPLAILYEADESAGPATLRLCGHIGLPIGHSLIVGRASMSSSEGLVPDCRDAGGAETFIVDYDERFDSIS